MAQKKRKQATEQVSVTPPKLRNPTGKGGFGDNPQNRNPGGWKKENTISYQYMRFLNMTPKELSEFSKTPDDERTIAMDIAYQRVLASRKSLMDVKEITDRTEGKAQQNMDITSGGESLAPIVRIIDERQRDIDTSGTRKTIGQ